MFEYIRERNRGHFRGSSQFARLVIQVAAVLNPFNSLPSGHTAQTVVRQSSTVS